MQPTEPHSISPLYIKTVLPLYKFRAQSLSLCRKAARAKGMLGGSSGPGNMIKTAAHQLPFCSSFAMTHSLSDFSFTDGDSQLANNAKPPEH